MSNEQVSQVQVNQAVRVLTGRRLKYTVLIKKDGLVVSEFQSQNPPKLDFNVEARALFVMQMIADYEGSPACKWEDGMVITCEENVT